MNEFDNIKKKMDSYSLDNYDLSQGWSKLQKRKPVKRFLILRISTGVAAACVLLITGYWLFNQDHKKERVRISTIQKNRDKKSAAQLTDQHVLVKTDLVNKDQTYPKKRKQDPLGRTEVAVFSFSQKNIVSRDSANLLKSHPLVGNSTDPTEPVYPLAMNASGIQKKSLEIINEQELHAMIMIPEEPQKKNSKLLTFFAEKGEQAEYTDVKFSSMPASTLQVSF